MNMKTNAGFTLIEVLISMIVLAVGLLGLAAVQSSSLRNNQSAYYRSQATQLAYDMADRIRANREDAERAALSKYVSLPPANALQKSACNGTTGCTSALMAENDVFEWNRDVTGTLPLGQGSINLGGATGVFIITIKWDDNRDNDRDGDGGALDGDTDADGDTDDDPDFQMSFQL